MIPTEPTHVIRRQAQSWCRPGTRVRMLGSIAPVDEFYEVWALCMYPDRIVRPVPVDAIERIGDG